MKAVILKGVTLAEQVVLSEVEIGVCPASGGPCIPGKDRAFVERVCRGAGDLFYGMGISL